MIPDRQYITIAEYACEAHVSERHVRSLIAQRRIPAVHIGRLVRIPRSALDMGSARAPEPAMVSPRAARKGARL